MNFSISDLKKSTIKICLTAFAAALVLILLYDIITGIYPFGEYSFLKKDMYHQYLPFLMELRRKLLNGENLSYSFDLGLGDSFYAMFVYYLSDPLNFLAVYLPEKVTLEYLTAVTQLKIALSAAFMCRYLRYRNDRVEPLYVIMMSLCYAFSGYVAAYSWNVMWMWAIALSPMVIMGFERIMKGESSMQYIIFLTMTVFTNYYMAMVLCIYLVLYFMVCAIEAKRGIKDTFTSLVRIFFSTLISAGLNGVLLIPEAAALTHTTFSRHNFPERIKFYMSVPTLLLRSLLLVEPEDGLAHDPNIYATLLVLLILPLFFANGRISLGSRIAKGVLALFFLLSFNTNVLEYIWHGLNYPDSIPAREGYLYIMLLITMVYDTLEGVKDIKRIYLFASPLLLILMTLTAFCFARDDTHVNDYTWVVNGVFILAYIINFIVFIRYEEIYMKWGKAAFSAFLVAELLINFCVEADRDVKRSSYYSKFDNYQALVQTAMKDNRHNQGHFTRFASVDENIRNEGALMGYANDSYFSSTISSAKEIFYREFGMKSSRVHYMASGLTPFTMAILGIDYILADDFRNNGTDYDVAYYQEEKDGDYLYMNLFSLPFGYTVPSGDYTLDATLYEISDPIDRQNQACVDLMGDEVFHKMDISDIREEEGSTGFTVPEEGHYYAYTTADIEKISEYRQGELYGEFSDMDHNSIMDLGRLDKDDVIELEADDEHKDEYFVLSVYRFDPVNMQQLKILLSNNSLTVTDFSNDHIEGIIDIPEGRDLVLAMPYDSGWEVTIDGLNKNDTKLFYDMLMQIPLQPGYHQIILRYHIPHLKEGIMVSLVSLLLFVMYCAVFGRFGRQNSEG